ncbi:hypothetical protein HMI55_003704, partial [Coelomomyces lativittatus]
MIVCHTLLGVSAQRFNDDKENIKLIGTLFHPSMEQGLKSLKTHLFFNPNTQKSFIVPSDIQWRLGTQTFKVHLKGTEEVHRNENPEVMLVKTNKNEHPSPLFQFQWTGFQGHFSKCMAELTVNSNETPPTTTSYFLFLCFSETCQQPFQVYYVKEFVQPHFWNRFFEKRFTLILNCTIQSQEKSVFNYAYETPFTINNLQSFREDPFVLNEDQWKNVVHSATNESPVY